MRTGFVTVPLFLCILSSLAAGAELHSKAAVMTMNNAVERLAGGLAIPTVGDAEYGRTDFEPFIQFQHYLKQSYPVVFDAMEFWHVNEHGLALRWPGRNSQAKPLLFLSHYDVVPASEPMSDTSPGGMARKESGSASLPPIQHYQDAWSYGPFDGVVSGGRVYGRGALDMKGMLFALMEAAEYQIREDFIPPQDIWFAFGHDEETGGQQGAAAIAQWFAERNIHFAAVFDEGGYIVAEGSVLPAIDRPMALVGMGEKGFVTLRIRVEGMGGHSSMPPPKGAVVLASEIVSRLNESPMQARIIPPVEEFLTLLAGEYFPQADMPGKREALGKRLMEEMGRNPATNALIRTTTAFTMMRGSDAANVLPATAEITVNFRILPGDTVSDVLNHVENVCHGYETSIEIVGTAREPSSVSDHRSPFFKAISSLVKELHPDALVLPYLTIGGTDAYKYQQVSDAQFRFMPVLINQYEQQTIHNANEYLSVANYHGMIQFFSGLFTAIDTAGNEK